MSTGDPLMLIPSTAYRPPERDLTQVCWPFVSRTLRPMELSVSWSTAMTSLLSRIWLVVSPETIARGSLPAINGEDHIDHRLKCVFASSVLSPGLPTSSMSASAQCPGPTEVAWFGVEELM